MMIVFFGFVLVALLGAFLGADSRPGAHDQPAPTWPFYRRRG
jgi:hypothetical protein